MSEFELSGLLSMDAFSMVGGLEDATDASGELAVLGTPHPFGW